MSNEISIEPTRDVILKPYTLLDLAALYGVTRKTFYRWLKPFQQELGKRVGYYYTIPQVKLIFEKLDYPSFPIVKHK